MAAQGETMTQLYRITILPGQRLGELVKRLNGYAPASKEDLWECVLTEKQVKEIETLYVQRGTPRVELSPIGPAVLNLQPRIRMLQDEVKRLTLKLDGAQDELAAVRRRRPQWWIRLFGE
jgi:hypothetical protein